MRIYVPTRDYLHLCTQIRKYVHGGTIKYNESCDIWSLGALMYAMVTADTSPVILATATPQALAKQVF
jgi:serine/threonine protein kinase